MKDIRQRLLATFQVEHRDHLSRIRAILVEFENEGVTTSPNLDEAFRRAHSLKGAARAVDLAQVETLAHRLETLFSRIREGSMRLDRPVIAAVNKVLDASEDWVAALAASQTSVEPAGALNAIEQVLGMQPEVANENELSAAAAPASDKPVSIVSDLDPAGAHSPSQAKPGVLVPFEASTRLEAASTTVTPARNDTAASALAFQSVDTVRVGAENLDRLLRSAGQLLTEGLRQDLVRQELNILGRKIAGIQDEWERTRRASAAPLRRLSASPEFARLARFLDSMDRQMRSLPGQTRAVSLLQQRSSWALQHLGEQLQQDVRQARMVPVESVFEGFHKMMRDLARAESKDFEFRVSGFEVQADRMVLQALKDPVMHLLRNAVGHGMESQEDRRRQGKHPAGRVTLRIEAKRNQLELTVEDDGRGMDLDRIAEVAIRKGLLSAAAAAALSPQEVARLIFQAGFSTSQFITELSGRGMGLSVVYEAVVALQGEVDIQRKDGSGTAIAISVPLSISTHRLLLVACQGQTFGIPLHGIERLYRIRLQEVETVEGRPVLPLHGQLVPLLSLASLIGIGGAVVNVDDETIPVVLLKWGEKRAAVAVDALLSQVDGLVQDLGPLFTRVGKVAGGILLGDGSVSLVLNPPDLVDSVKALGGMLPLRTAAPELMQKTSSILVVDDSITTRTLEKSILEAQGYHVRVAVDGVNALAELRSQPVDLVISDIQMPLMDGLELLAEIKRDSNLSRIPVIMVTSLESREDKERGMSLGADAYIVKRKFDQRDLLDTIRQIL